MTDEYLTIHGLCTASIKVRGSTFLAEASPVPSPEEAERFVHDRSRRFHDASHHCFAYRTGVGDSAIYRYHDDGEPSGTGGKPIFQVLCGRDLTNVIVVVTRYFGGTKLGTGGLARAYAAAAAAALDRCRVETQILYQTIDIRFPYDATSALMRLIGQVQGRILDTQYDAETRIRVDIRLREVASFREKVVDATRGKAHILSEPVLS
jgi:uncharacterized YigZ family protein